MDTSKHRADIPDKTSTFLREGESERCDFKRSPEGISGDDLVAFANTEIGGSILVGVSEIASSGGAQTGLVVGCDVSDATILQIANKALACLPPVAIKVHIESVNELSFLRVDVPSSSTKPHCTPKGVYCRRDGSRNRAIKGTPRCRSSQRAVQNIPANETISAIFAERASNPLLDRITIDLANPR